MSNVHTPIQFGVADSADFEADTLTFSMEPGYRAVAGPVAIVPRATYDALLDALRLGRQIGDQCSRGFLARFYAAADAALAAATSEQPRPSPSSNSGGAA